MAAGTLPWPGAKNGPCLEACARRDCAATRAIAASTCRLCGEEIGFDKRFYDEGSGVYVHAVCLEVSIDLGFM